MGYKVRLSGLSPNSLFHIHPKTSFTSYSKSYFTEKENSNPACGIWAHLWYLNDLNNDDRILGNKDIKQTQMYTQTWLADAKKKKI